MRMSANCCRIAEMRERRDDFVERERGNLEKKKRMLTWQRREFEMYE